MSPLQLVNLPPLMKLTSGRPEIVIALIDGPVWMDRPDLWSASVRHLVNHLPSTCVYPTSDVCIHGTFVAGILSARRSSPAPAICPNCTLLVRSVFSEGLEATGKLPTTTSDELSLAIVDAVRSGARIVNLSLSVMAPSAYDERQLGEALSYAASRGVIIVAAAGNQGEIGGSPLFQHAWPIPVAGCDPSGQPSRMSNIGRSIGIRGLLAPSENIKSLTPSGDLETFSGTSAAAPFVTGAMALLWSEFPGAPAARIKLAASGENRATRKALVPPLLDAWAAYGELCRVFNGRNIS